MIDIEDLLVFAGLIVLLVVSFHFGLWFGIAVAGGYLILIGLWYGKVKAQQSTQTRVKK
ncbi:MAG: hypothetical protein ACJ71W_22030 [Terriglobales bacterium]